MQIDKQMCRRWKDFLNLAKDISLIISFLRLDRIRKYIYSMDRRKSRVWSYRIPDICPNLFQLFYSRIFKKKKDEKLRKKYYSFIHLYIYIYSTIRLEFCNSFPYRIFRTKTSNRHFFSKLMIDQKKKKKTFLLLEIFQITKRTKKRSKF